MAMNAPALAGLIKSKLLAGTPTAVDNAAMQAMCTAIAEAVIEHLTANALVTVSVSTTGTASAQTGGGTGSIS